VSFYNIIIYGKNCQIKIETGERRLSVEIAKKIAEILGFDWTKFFEQ